MDAKAALQRTRRWFATLNPWAVDSIITLTCVILAFASTATRGSIPKADYQPMNAFGAVLVLFATLPLMLRRRAPLAVFIVMSTAVVVLSAAGYNEGLLPFFLYATAVALAASCDLRTTVIATTFMFVALVGLLLFGDTGFDFGNFLVNLAIFASAFMIGITIRSRRLRIEALEERASAIEREQEEESRRLLADERLRIARELHDVVAHSMGVIAVQAGVGEHVIDADPAAAKRSLRAISDVSRSTLAEIRHLLGVLREDDADPTASYTPAPGLADLERLVRELDGSGVHVELARTGRVHEVPRGVDLTAYRIIQEALTNVLKHAGPAQATVVVDYEPTALRLEITDDGRGVNGRASDGGHGLIGMRERVAVFGGTLKTGPRPGGGYQVVAQLPYEESS